MRVREENIIRIAEENKGIAVPPESPITDVLCWFFVLLDCCNNYFLVHVVVLYQLLEIRTMRFD
jgi:hypothetical protein